MQQNTTIKTVHCSGVYSKRSDSHSEHSHTIKTHRLNATTTEYSSHRKIQAFNAVKYNPANVDAFDFQANT